MQVIEHIEVGSGGAASIEFTSIPATYTDLLLVLSMRSNVSASGWYDIFVRPNNDSANASSRVLYGSGSSVASFPESLINVRTSSASTTANTFGNASIYIPNYTSSAAKSFSLDVVGENNATASFQGIQASLWNVTSAITSFTIIPQSGNLVQYSSATLFGITAGSDGTTTVS